MFWFNLYGSLIINISMLVLIATFLTKIPFVKRVISEEHGSRLADRLLLGVIFGMFCIFSTCTGVRVSGAIQNTRVLGALAGGMLGGSAVGIPAAVIGAVHRYLYDVQGLTAISCALSTLFEGLLGSFVWYAAKKKDVNLGPKTLFAVTAFAEACQMGIVLITARPFEDALTLVKAVALPMILCNSFGMVLFFSVFKEVFTRQDLLAADKIRLALTIADQCIPYIRKGQVTEKEYQEMAAIIQRISGCLGVVFLPAERGRVAQTADYELPEDFLEQMDHAVRHQTVFRKKERGKKLPAKCVAVGGRLATGSEAWAYLVLFFSRHVESIQSELNFVEGLVKFFSTNYELVQIENQKKLREQAEFRALQSQINPHFLFNCLNTITYFCREKPERARELLMALSVYFRHTLNSSSAYMIGVEREMEQVRAYLMLEKARFEEKLQIEIDFPEEASVQVPTLILQPIVENAVKHGAMKREVGMVRISGRMSQEGLGISVEDNGYGIPESVLRGFYDKDTTGQYGLLNVDARLRSIYGENHGLKIRTGEDGTCISMLIPREGLETEKCV